MRSSIFIAGGILAAGVMAVLWHQGDASDEVRPRKAIPSGAVDTALLGNLPPPAAASGTQSLVPSQQPPESANYPARRSVTVIFDDGTQIPVELKDPGVFNPPYVPKGRLLDQHQTLVDAATAGDAAAARMLYVELRSCQTYQRLIKKTTSDPEMQEALQELGSRCEGVSDEMLETRDHWMRVAAEGGDYLARQDWAFELGKTVEAYRVIEGFWLDGNASALPLMSHLAKHGISSDTAMGEPDYVRAYAFNLIYLKLDMAARAHGQSWKPPESQRLDRYIAYEQHLKQIGGYLTPQQQSDAERLAIRMIRNNANCCTGTF